MSTLFSELSQEDKLHHEISEWIEEQGFPAYSLDELLYTHVWEEPFMTTKQFSEAQELMSQFHMLP